MTLPYAIGAIKKQQLVAPRKNIRSLRQFDRTPIASLDKKSRSRNGLPRKLALYQSLKFNHPLL
jgi:hypothetical protein